MMDELFADLPEQRPPTVLYADRHALYPCTRCGGTGKEENPHFPGSYRWMCWDPKCRGCDGAGGRLVYVGAVTDA